MRDLPRYELRPHGDSAVVVRFGTSLEPELFEPIRMFCELLEQHPLRGINEWVPAYTTVTVFFEPLQLSYSDVIAHLQRLLSMPGDTAVRSQRMVEIPVCYGDDFGPDLDKVANIHGISPEEVIRIHSGVDYSVYMIGFVPGFPYLGGLPERIATPRREMPRTRVPAGSVGIAGVQTGIYPLSSPGGWQIIGQTPLALFRPWDDPPNLLRAGDRVRFRPIEFFKLKEGPS